MRDTSTRGRVAWACAWLLLAAVPAFGQGSGPPGGQGTDKRANLVVRLPANARLVVDGTETKQTGEVRKFFSPPLPAGQVFRYELVATWTGPDGEPVRVVEVVRVRAGETTPIDLRTAKRQPVDKPPVDKPPVDKPPVDKPPADKKPEVDVPYVSSSPEVVDKMLEVAKLTKDDVVYDLGCGDGRIVIAAAKKYGCKAVGIDIDPERVAESRDNVKKAGVDDLVSIEKKNFFTVDLVKATVVTLYLTTGTNEKLIPQLEQMKPGSRVVTHAFPVPGVEVKKRYEVEGKDGRPISVFLYELPFQKK